MRSCAHVHVRRSLSLAKRRTWPKSKSSAPPRLPWEWRSLPSAIGPPPASCRNKIKGSEASGHRSGQTRCLTVMRWLLLVLWALSAEADFFQLDSISNVSSYYFNYFYCNIWEGDCQPHQDDASQQGKRGADYQNKHIKNHLSSPWSPSLLGVTVPTRDPWAGFPQDYMSLLHQWYCSLGQCCDSGDCRVTNNITGTAPKCLLVSKMNKMSTHNLKWCSGFLSVDKLSVYAFFYKY